VGEEAPPDTPGVDYGGTCLVGFNTWNGTTSGIDGTFQADYVEGSGPQYTAPGVAGAPVKVYFCINIGVWAGGTFMEFEVGVDELSFQGPAPATAVTGRPAAVPRMALLQNYPNPFNSTTRIAYSLQAAGPVRLGIYDASGRLVRNLEHGIRAAGGHTAFWDGCDESGVSAGTGVYFCRMVADGAMETRKIIMIK
jgi:hypothetical protein